MLPKKLAHKIHVLLKTIFAHTRSKTCVAVYIYYSIRRSLLCFCYKRLRAEIIRVQYSAVPQTYDASVRVNQGKKKKKQSDTRRYSIISEKSLFIVLIEERQGEGGGGRSRTNNI